jgi:uncharacterized protein DUF3106
MKRVKFMAGWMSVGVVCAILLSSPCLAQRHGSPIFAQQRHQGAAPPRSNSHPPQQHAGDWLRKHQNMSPAERQKALESDPGFRRLPPAQQQVLRQRLQHFSSLPAQQQTRMLERMDTWAHLTPTQKDQARQIHGQMQQLPPDRQRMVRTAIGDLRGMPPQQRDQIIDSPRFKSMFSQQERDIMRGATRLPLAPPGSPE